MTDLTTLQETLNIRFKDESLLRQALVHSSYSNENPESAPVSNERLEFLGDAVLGMIMAEKLYELLPDASEGELTRLRAALVRRTTLYRIAVTIELNRYLYLGRGEEASGGRHKSTNLAGAMEAFIAAIFLDRGPESATDFVLRLFATHIEGITRGGAAVDHKSRLQQLMQSSQREIPAYRITQVSGSSHNPLFTAEVSTGDTILGSGSGKSKKLAEAEAARSALEQLQ